MAELPRLGALISGRFRIESVLGQGGMAAVFAATDTLTGRAVALKWLAPSSSESADAVLRFMAEARVTAKIEHPNVVTVIDVGREGQSPFLVMERLRGESLGQRLARGRLSVNEALDIVIPACRGIAEAHAEGVIHRDLKPDNIFLCESHDGRPLPKVVDFGVAKLRQSQTASLTKSGVVIGTPAYMSPEQIGTPREADPRFDVYSMGVVLYEALTGSLPHDASELVVLVRQIAEGNAVPVRSRAPEVPAALDAVVHKAMHADREQRYATMNELIGALERARPERSAAVVRHTPQKSAPRSAPPPHTPRPEPRRPLALIVVFGVLLVLAIAVLGTLGAVLVWSKYPDARAIAEPAEEEIADPLRPDVDLTFAGECELEFDGRLLVRSTYGGLAVDAYHADRHVASLIALCTQGPLEGPVDVGTSYNGRGVFFEISDPHRARWGNQPGLAPPGTPAGVFHFTRWEPTSGIVDLSFERVVLHHSANATPCTVNGRVRTYGYTGGVPESGAGAAE